MTNFDSRDAMNEALLIIAAKEGKVQAVKCLVSIHILLEQNVFFHGSKLL